MSSSVPKVPHLQGTEASAGCGEADSGVAVGVNLYTGQATAMDVIRSRRSSASWATEVRQHWAKGASVVIVAVGARDLTGDRRQVTGDNSADFTR